MAQAPPPQPPRLQPVGRRRGAIDVALWDIAARSPTSRSPRSSGSPARRSRPTRPPGTSSPTPEEVFNEAQPSAKAQGYHGFKIQFWDGLDRDIPRFRAAREAVGDDFPLMQDAAGMYTYTQALAAGRVLGELSY